MTQIDIKLESGTQDLTVEGGDLVLLDDEGDVITQRVGVRLQHWVNDWYLDTTVYMRYIEIILRKNPNISEVVGEFRRAIESIPGVLRLTKFEGNYDAAARKFVADVEVLTEEGAISLGVG